MDNTESNIEKCPVMHGSMTKNTTSGTSNKDWWPDQLNLSILHQHDRNQIQWEKTLIINLSLKSLTILL